MLDVIAHADLAIPALLLLAAPLVTGTGTRLPGWGVLLAGAGLAVIPVLAYWLTGRTHPNAIGGLIQWNDAAGYLDCARQYLAGAPGSGGCGMRPYYTTYFGMLQLAGGGHVQAALLLQAAVAGLGCAWMARAMAAPLGPAGAMAGFAALLAFASQFTMTTLTENAGLVLGGLALVALWRRAEGVSVPEFAAVMLALGLAFNARPGALLVLPALLGWAVWRGGGSRWRRGLMGAAGTAALAAAWGITGALSQLVEPGQPQLHSNAVYVLYGLSVGGARYLQILVDHPELKSLPLPEFLDAGYALAFENLRERPHLLLIGLARGVAHYFYELFRFVEFWPLRGALAGLWLAGLVAAWRRRGEAGPRLLLVIQAAIVATSPILTWYGGNRVFAVTYAADALLVALGVAWLTGAGARLRPGRVSAGGGAFLAAGVALAPVILAPLIAGRPSLPAMGPLPACPPGERALVVDLGRDATTLSLVGAGAESLQPLAVEHAAFVRRLDRWAANREELAALPAGTSLIQARESFLWDGPLPPEGPAQVCVRREAGEWLGRATLFQPLGRE